VAEFLQRHPNPTDERFHAWAEGKGVAPDKAEAIAYRLATAQARFREGGKANETGTKLSAIPPAKLAEGAKIEAEHTSDQPTQRRIAADHIAELGTGYYPALKQLEERLKKTAAEGFLTGYRDKRAAVDAEYSATAKPEREHLRRQIAADGNAMEASKPAAQEVGLDYSRPGDSEQQAQAMPSSESTRMRDLPWIKTRAQELDAANGNLPIALRNMLQPQEKKQELPFETNMEPGAAEARSRRVVGSGVEP
jgi:hypothetical protein